MTQELDGIKLEHFYKKCYLERQDGKVKMVLTFPSNTGCGSVELLEVAGPLLNAGDLLAERLDLGDQPVAFCLVAHSGSAINLPLECVDVLHHAVAAVSLEVALGRLGAELGPRLDLHGVPRSLDRAARLGERLHLLRAVLHVRHVVLAGRLGDDWLAPVELAVVEAGNQLLVGAVVSR